MILLLLALVVLVLIYTASYYQFSAQSTVSWVILGAADSGHVRRKDWTRKSEFEQCRATIHVHCWHSSKVT